MRFFYISRLLPWKISFSCEEFFVSSQDSITKTNIYVHLKLLLIFKFHAVYKVVHQKTKAYISEYILIFLLFIYSSVYNKMPFKARHWKNFECRQVSWMTDPISGYLSNKNNHWQNTNVSVADSVNIWA